MRKGFALIAVGAISLIPRCSQTVPLPVADASVDAEAGACPETIHVGTVCTNKGLSCPYPSNGRCDSYKSYVCNGSLFYAHDDLGPGTACSQVGLECRRPDTECDSCTCDGTTFNCEVGCCTTDCPYCPPSSTVVSGNSCNTTLTCASDYPCDAGSAACSCVDPIWTMCRCIATAVTLAPSENAPLGIAVDGTNVYWANSGDGTIRKVAIGGAYPRRSHPVRDLLPLSSSTRRAPIGRPGEASAA